MEPPPENPFQSPQTVDEPPGADVPLPEDPRRSVPGSVVLAWMGSFVFSVLVLATWGTMGQWSLWLSVLGVATGFALLVSRPTMRSLGLAFYGIQLLHLGFAGVDSALRGNEQALLVLLPLAASAVILLLLMTGDSVGYYKGRDK